MQKQRPEKMAPQQRFVSLRLDSDATSVRGVDVGTRTMRFSFSSEEPVDTWYGKEILSHASGAIRLSGMRQKTMPLLFNHCMDDLLGIVESVDLGPDRRLHATVRFGKDERGEWAMQQAADGILVNVSFMYRIYKMLEDTETETYTAVDWEPFEVSLVTVPADATVGAGRAAADAENAIEYARTVQLTPDIDPDAPAPDEPVLPPATADAIRAATPTQPATAGFLISGASTMTHAAQDQAAGAATVDQTQSRLLGAEEERKRIAEIDAMCRAHGVPDETRAGLIQKGATVSEARGAVLDLQLSRKAAPVANMGDGYAPDLSAKEKANYSMLRAINAVITNSWKEAGFEAEVSNDIAKRMGKPSNGFFMPTNLPFAARAQYAAGASATGGAIVATNLLAGSFIEILRAKARVLQQGATVLSGLVGNVDIPRQTGASSTYWVTEGGNLTESEATFDKVSLSLKSIGTYSAVTRQMLLQSTPDIEMLARADLIAQIALGIDLAALSGTGTGGQPTGVANVAGIGSVIGGTNGAAVTIDHLIDLETAIANANADVDGMSYITNAKTVGALKKLKSTTGQYLWTNLPSGQRSGTPGEINGYAVARTNQARSNLTKGTASGVCSEIFMGNWAELLIGEWGVLEIVPNPYDGTLFKQGGVLLRAMQSLDVAVRHAASFAVMSDALTS